MGISRMVVPHRIVVCDYTQWCTVYHYLLWGHPLLSFGVYIFWITPLCTPSIPLSHEYHHFQSREFLQIFHKYQWPKHTHETPKWKKYPCYPPFSLVKFDTVKLWVAFFILNMFELYPLKTWLKFWVTFVELSPNERKTTTRFFFASTSKKVPPSHHHCSHPFIQKQNEEQQKTVLKNTVNYKGFHEDFILGRDPEFCWDLFLLHVCWPFAKGSTFSPYSLGRNLSSKVRMSGCLQRMRQVWMPGLLVSRRVLRCHIELLQNMIIYEPFCIYIYIICTYGWEPLSMYGMV